ncbi:MAG: sugar transferase [Acidobacteriota bacterium]
MLKEQARALFWGVLLLDLALVAVAFVLAWWARAYVLPALMPELLAAPFYPLRLYLPLLLPAVGVWALLLLGSGRYRSHRTVPLVEEAREISRVCLLGMALLALVVYAFRLDQHLLAGDEMSRLWVLLFGLFATVLLLGEKLTLRMLSRYARAKGYNYRTMIIVGTNRGAIDFAESVRDHRYWGYRILGFVAHPNGARPRVPKPYPLLGTLDELTEIVENNVVDDVVFCVGRRDLDALEDLFLALQEQGIRTRFALNLFPHTKARARLEELDGVPLLTFSTAPEQLVPLTLKRAIDVGLSVLLLVIGTPIIVVIALIIKLSSGGGRILYRQVRCGLNGRRFVLYKFRTMVENAEQQLAELLPLNEMNGPAFKLKRDPRVTTFGRFLRRFSLDELPQLWNVLRGDMSLVGPRPPIPEEVAQYQRWQRRRLSMKPGLTCLWQVNGRNQLDFDRWMELDLQYIDTWSPWLDCKILLRTVPAVLTGRGAS